MMADSCNRAQFPSKSGDACRREATGRALFAVCVALSAACGEAATMARSESPETVSTDALHVVGAPDIVSHIVDLVPVTPDSIWVLNLRSGRTPARQRRLDSALRPRAALHPRRSPLHRHIGQPRRAVRPRARHPTLTLGRGCHEW